MKLIVDGTPKEVADLLKELQGQPNKTIELIAKLFDDIKISRI